MNWDAMVAFDERNRLYLTDSSVRKLLTKDTELTYDGSEQLDSVLGIK
jgi:hypothetical protein